DQSSQPTTVVLRRSSTNPDHAMSPAAASTAPALLSTVIRARESEARSSTYTGELVAPAPPPKDQMRRPSSIAVDAMVVASRSSSLLPVTELTPPPWTPTIFLLDRSSA